MTFVLYKDVAGEYRWRLWFGNHEPVADSAEGYTHKSDALNMIRKIINSAPGAQLQDKT